MIPTEPDKAPLRDDLLIPALGHHFVSQSGLTGSQMLGKGHLSLIALLEMSTDHRIPILDRLYAEVIVSDPYIRTSVEQARVAHTRAIGRG